MTDERLSLIGDALEHAAAADLARHARSWRPRRRVAVLIAVAAIAVPVGAVAATELLSNGGVAASLPAGTLSLVGTHPTCTTVQTDVEYRCTLASAPSADGGPPPGQWLGTVEPTVDASKHVNGGCRALTDKGETWECYIGRAAVAQKIISAGFLGAYAPGPGVG